ncbi:hypothetical protein GYMLUDRAFT_248294 [Collybiopsis luxurians FD-317 M1]|uniref:Uncharacterized protein n=1 Tax=Collybiopsis luxurians FD-317 M1 TaxID=944289 RepID=A0A0D0AYU2_9AGAR|nr:hypothetical protein GYMLUDRAFT_248294 [Collybiopsis luxurians FD-317 M1]
MLSSWNLLHESTPSFSQHVPPSSIPFFHPSRHDIGLNCNDIVNAQSSDSNAVASSSEPPLLSHSDFVLDDLRKLTSFHVNISGWTCEGHHKPIKVLRSDLLKHQCDCLCLIKTAEARTAGFSNLTPLSELDFLLSAKALRL